MGRCDDPQKCYCLDVEMGWNSDLFCFRDIVPCAGKNVRTVCVFEVLI